MWLENLSRRLARKKEHYLVGDDEMTPAKKEKRGEEMAEQKSWDKDKEKDKNPEQDQPRRSLDQTLARQRSSESNVVSPTKEQSDQAKDALFTKEEEKDGVTTIVSSISEEEANKVKTTIEGLPKYQNLTLAIHGVPGDVNLTADGTLNSDRSERLDKTVEEMNEIYEKIAGPNPMPNREGNELTKAELGFRANVMAAQGNTLKSYSRQLKSMREKGSLDENDKKKLEDMEKGLIGVTTNP